MYKMTLIALFLASALCFSQGVEKYKVVSIDSTSLEGYNIIGISDQVGNRKKVFSPKDTSKVKAAVIKVGNKYPLILEEFDLHKALRENNGNPVSMRGNYALFVDSIEILASKEKAYRTSCLKGLVYIKCPRCPSLPRD